MRKQHGGFFFDTSLGDTGLGAMVPWMSLTKTIAKHVAKKR